MTRLTIRHNASAPVAKDRPDIQGRIAAMRAECKRIHDAGGRGYGKISREADALAVRLAYHRWEAVRITQGAVFPCVSVVAHADTKRELLRTLAAICRTDNQPRGHEKYETKR